MQTDFQKAARRDLGDFAQNVQLSGHPIVESENGVEYKNYLNRTVFTVYHDRLDEENKDRVELAIGIDNIAEELNCEIADIEAWLSSLQSMVHKATSKSPLWWPRISLGSEADVGVFCREFRELLREAKKATELRPPKPPPTDERVMAAILTRRGQPDFRSRLLRAYGSRCAISRCNDAVVLEAAHILSHAQEQDYRTSNGLILRADLHTLFDLNLVSINPSTATVVVSKQLSDTYQAFRGQQCLIPKEQVDQPDSIALMQHYRAWKENERSVG